MGNPAVLAPGPSERASATPAAWRGFERLATPESRRRLAAGEPVAVSPASDGHLLLVLEGRLELRANGDAAALATFGPGDVLRDLEAFSVRGLRVVAASPTELLELPQSALEASPAAALHVGAEAIEAFQRRVLGHVDALREHRRDRRLAGMFLVHLLGIVCVYTATLGLLPSLQPYLPHGSTIVSAPLQLVFLLGTAHFVWRSGLPIAEFGLHARGLLRSIAEGLAWTVPLALAVVGVKAAWLSASGATGPLFEFADNVRALGPGTLALLVAGYFVSAAAQEFVVRGGVQGGLERWLALPGARLWALLLSNLLFALTHLHVSLGATVFSLFAGGCWGVLYARQRTLAGVVASHVALGTFAFFVLGVGV